MSLFLVAKVKKKATKITTINNVDKSNSTNNVESNTNSNNTVLVNVPTTVVMRNDGEPRLVHVDHSFCN